ncbi:PQQ-binding-like beta-propeller repeat protein [Winogradskyella helgolandensis]|uniref:PQQ-binding-like beta-propeller repeat protein n=1 Tax=Winogradskyella helgolandensis TaxID=2697010 RepID=UPI0015CDA463|nr:PQQ-binding-like beta-propeller repeat protein [Winogradskyella helgolandensis]
MIKSHYKVLLILFCLVYACKNKGSGVFSSSISELISIENSFQFYENYDGYIIKENSITKEKIWEHKKLYNLSIKVLDSGNSIYYTTPNTVVSIDKINGEVNFIIKENFTGRTYDLLSHNNEIIASSLYGSYSFSKSTGQILWSLLPSSSTILGNPKILINNDTLFVAGNFKPDIKTTLFSFNLNNKSRISEIDLPKTVVTNLVLVQNNLIFGAGQSIMEREIFSISKDDLKLNWQLEQNIDHSSRIVPNKENIVFFNFKNQVFELDTKSLVIKERYTLPDNYFELLFINDDKLIASNNSSLVIYSLPNDKKKYFRNIKTAGPWVINNEIYYANKTSIKKLAELK